MQREANRVPRLRTTQLRAVRRRKGQGAQVDHIHARTCLKDANVMGSRARGQGGVRLRHPPWQAAEINKAETLRTIEGVAQVEAILV